MTRILPNNVIQCFSGKGVGVSIYKDLEWGWDTAIWKTGGRTSKRRAKYVHGKLKTWKEHKKTNIHDQHVPYDMYCNATAVPKIDSVYKQGKNYHPQVCVEEWRYTDAENQQCNMLSDDDDDDGFFQGWKEGQKIFVTCLGLQN